MKDSQQEGDVLCVPCPGFALDYFFDLFSDVVH
ncbi:MAG: hypothetical protein QOH42_1914, partial [Blastocatellia bacterium]|nr:hypothetical protein [Blastocatellia bacterium]